MRPMAPYLVVMSHDWVPVKVVSLTVFIVCLTLSHTHIHTHTHVHTHIHTDIDIEEPDDRVFNVELRRSASIRFHGPCKLRIDKDFDRNVFHVTIITRDDERLIVNWQIDHIRQYGSNKNAFKFQSGRWAQLSTRVLYQGLGLGRGGGGKSDMSTQSYSHRNFHNQN